MSTKKKITLRELRQYLNGRSQAELIDDIAHLFSNLEAVRDYYSIRLGAGPDEGLLARYKAVIQQEFFPARGYGQARLSVARRAIADYKRMSTSIEGLADLMLFYVEMGVKFTNDYGDIDESFYESMESTYERAAKLIVEHDLQDQFAPRCQAIVDDTVKIGWGFHDNLSLIYGELFGE